MTILVKFLIVGKIDYLLNFLGECYTGRIIPSPSGQTFENPFPNNVKDLILKNMVNEFLRFTPFYISNADCKSTNKEYAKHNPCPNASLVSFNNNSNFSIDI